MPQNQQLEIPDTGAVFTWGRSKFSDNQPSHFFIRNDPIVDISCGDEHTVLVCQKGRVFVFGSNGSGQLGLGHTRSMNKPTCVKVLKPWSIALTACGRAHSLFATTTVPSVIFSCGANADGQLGVGDQQDRHIPTQVHPDIPAESRITALSAGSMHSALLTDTGEVWTWGNNADGQCGVDDTSSVVSIPTKVVLAAEIISLSCGYYHTLFASRDAVWAVGEGDSGKLGLDNKHENQITPKKLNWNNSSPIIAVAAGGSHSLVLTEEGDVYGFGNNFSGQLGTDNNGTVEETVTKIPIQEQVVRIACGESHSAFILNDGQLWTCGDTRYGKLGHEGQSLQTAQLSLQADLRATLVKCGGCHTVALASAAEMGSESAALPPIKLKRQSITISSPPPSPRNDDDETETIASDKTVIMGNGDADHDDGDDDDDVEHEDAVSQTESAHDPPKMNHEKAEKEEEIIKELPEVLQEVSIQNKLFSRFRKTKNNPGSKACTVL